MPLQKKEVDFELRYEYDFVRDGNAENFFQRIQQKLKPFMEINGTSYKGYSADAAANDGDDMEQNQGMNDNKGGGKTAAESIAARRSLIRTEYVKNGDEQDSNTEISKKVLYNDDGEFFWIS